jgi:hypothetical protein
MVGVMMGVMVVVVVVGGSRFGKVSLVASGNRGWRWLRWQWWA